jgi:hypothetical protein
MHQLGMPTAEEITALSRMVNELAASVEKLAAKSSKRKSG